MGISSSNVRYDIGEDEIVLHLRKNTPDDKYQEGKYITGYTTFGGYETDTNSKVKVKRSILPDGFLRDFEMNMYIYYPSDPEEIKKNEYYIPVDEREGAVQDEPEPTVPKSEFDKLQNEVEELKKMMKMLMEMQKKG